MRPQDRDGLGSDAGLRWLLNARAGTRITCTRTFNAASSASRCCKENTLVCRSACRSGETFYEVSVSHRLGSVGTGHDESGDQLTLDHVRAIRDAVAIGSVARAPARHGITSLVSSDIGRQASHPQYAKTHKMLPRAMADAVSRRRLREGRTRAAAGVAGSALAGDHGSQGFESRRS